MSQHFTEMNVPEKSNKYKRYAYEKRAKRTPGVKRIQTPHIMVTKWDVEISNKRTKKVGRARDREDKYGDWNENRTDTMWEDNVNKAANDATRQRVQYMARRERSRQVIRSSLAEYGELMFPTYSLYNRGGWAAGVWESYGEYLEYNPEARKREQFWQALINSPEQNANDEPIEDE